MRWCVAVLLVAACSRSGPPDRYTVKGRVAGISGSELEIHHERIPTYKAEDGKVRGMESMQMTFTLADGVVAKDVAPGDPVRFTFEVRWDEKPALRVVQIEELPADTKLDL